MRQAVEEAARENILFNHRTVDRTLSGKDLAKFGEMNFIQGAEWHAKQSPWISVEERLPETNDGQSLYEVIVVTSDRRFLVVINTEVEHLVGLLGVTHWMPIPSFDEILEANRDVLERIKEKGD